jgi:hypothetical protein
MPICLISWKNNINVLLSSTLEVAVDFGILAACAQKGKSGASTPCNYKGGSLDPVAIGF